MKTLKLLSLLLLSTMIFSCSDKDPSSKEDSSKEIGNSPRIANKILNKLEFDREFATIEGEFYVWQTKQNEIVFLAKDNRERNLLILQGANNSTSLNDGNYEIVYLKHSIVVNNLDTGTKTYLKVPKPEEIAITNKVKAQDIQFDSEIAGYGLIYGSVDSKSDENVSIEVLKKQNSITEYLSSLNNRGTQCGSGGTGSTSCSISQNGGGGCSVSCGQGFYACCNIECHCVPNPT